MRQRDSMAFLRSYYEALKYAPTEAKIELVEAIMAYGLDGTLPKLEHPISKAMWPLFHGTLRASRKGWCDKLGEPFEEIDSGSTAAPPSLPPTVPPLQGPSGDNIVEDSIGKDSIGNRGNSGSQANRDARSVHVQWQAYKAAWQEATGRKLLSDSTQVAKDALNKLRARIKEGYTAEQVIEALWNACRDGFHVENKYKYITVDFILRPQQLEKWRQGSATVTKAKKTQDLMAAINKQRNENPEK